MKRIGFIGVTDKTDLLLYLSALLASMDLKVLLVDGTRMHRLSYTIPTIESNITEFEGFDIQIAADKKVDYFFKEEFQEEYDFILFDIDNSDFLDYISLQQLDFKFVVTTFEKFCIDQIENLFNQLFQSNENISLDVERVILNSVNCSIDEYYLNISTKNVNLNWPKSSFNLYYDEIDYSVKIENQHNHRINIKRLSKNYLSVLVSLTKLLTDLDDKSLKQAIKQLKRRG